MIGQVFQEGDTDGMTDFKAVCFFGKQIKKNPIETAKEYQVDSINVKQEYAAF